MRNLKMLRIRKRSKWVVGKEECLGGQIGCEEGQEDQARMLTMRKNMF